MRYLSALILAASLTVNAQDKYGPFRIESGDVYWEAAYPLAKGDSALTVKNALASRGPVKKVTGDGSQFFLTVEDWQLDKRYFKWGVHPQIYRDAKWGCVARVVVGSDSYTVTVKEIHYGGMTYSTDLSIGIRTNNEIARNWRDTVTKQGAFKQGQLKSVDLVGLNLKDLFAIVTGGF